VLPGLAYSQFMAEEFTSSELPYILHMPMEPKDYPKNNPGKIAIFAGMDELEVAAMLNKALKNVPGVRGLNSHMGSRYTSNAKDMKLFFKVIKKWDMFFIDSLTTADSVAYETGKKMDIDVAENNIFLDNKDDYQYITGQLKKLREMGR